MRTSIAQVIHFSRTVRCLIVSAVHREYARTEIADRERTEARRIIVFIIKEKEIEVG